MRRALRDERGQATVELVALVPLLAAIALAIGMFLAAHRVAEAADAAATAAAMAELQGSDPVAAARDAAPAWTRLRVRTSGGVARVRVRWKAPAIVAGLVDADRAVTFRPGGRP